MGSSPVTATIPFTRPERHLDRFLRQAIDWNGVRPLVVAFSGGADSCALLHASLVVAAGKAEVVAAHFDHRLDRQSTQRAEEARRLAVRLGASWRLGAAAENIPAFPRGLEDYARAKRYQFLETVHAEDNAAVVLTAHHLDDQVETVLLRVLFGTGLRGLGGIRACIGNVGRPWLALSRHAVRNQLLGSGIDSIHDPTNDDLSVPRNWVRQVLLPRLRQGDREFDATLARLAASAARARRHGDTLAKASVDYRENDSGPSVSATRLLRLPRILWPHALAGWTGDGCGPHDAGLLSNSPSRARLAELERQLQARAGNPAKRVEVSLSPGLCWIAFEDRLLLERRSFTATSRPFEVRLIVPGEAELPGGGKITVTRSVVQDWMFRGDPRRVAFQAPENSEIAIRNRRPGDRLRPIGAGHERKLKDVLIDAKIPSKQRDRLPLLTVDDQVAWVPGVTLDNRFRIGDDGEAWVAEWLPGQHSEE